MQLVYSSDLVNELANPAGNLFTNFTCCTRRSPKCTYESQELAHTKTRKSWGNRKNTRDEKPPHVANMLTRKKLNFHNKFSAWASDTTPQYEYVVVQHTHTLTHTNAAEKLRQKGKRCEWKLFHRAYATLLLPSNLTNWTNTHCIHTHTLTLQAFCSLSDSPF